MIKWVVVGVVSALLVIGGALGGAWLVLELGEAEEIRGSSTQEFVTTQEPEPAPPPEPGIAWPTNGFDGTRTRVSPYDHRPPFVRQWRRGLRSLVEFPPVVAYGRAYVANNDGVLFAIDTDTGDLDWSFSSGRVQAASPAVDDGVLYHAFMYRRRDGKSGNGEVIAFDARRGKVRWRRTLPGPVETSPLVLDGSVYVGDWTGRVYRLDARTGNVRWSHRTDGEIKGAVSATGGRLFVGSYDGRVYSLDARTGRRLWRESGQGSLLRSGAFYSTPAVAYGRVYIGSTDGRVYAFGATSGALLWSNATGGYVYGSPAVWRRSVLVGSYDGRFYSFDAATGDERWAFRANGPVSGAATVVDGLVYFSTLKRRTYALDARTGRQVWSFPDGQYSPVVTDRERLYVVGLARLYALRSR